MCTHSSPTWCPIFLLAHQLLSMETEACSVKHVCHRITIHPFSEQTPPTLTHSEGKHKCFCSLLEQPWQNILTRHLLLALLCALQNGYQGMCLSLPHLRQKPRPFWGSIGWHCVWGNNGYYVSSKIYATALSLQRPVPSAMIASSVNLLPNCTGVLINTVQTLLRWLMDEINEFSWSVTQIMLRNV